MDEPPLNCYLFIHLFVCLFTYLFRYFLRFTGYANVPPNPRPVIGFFALRVWGAYIWRGLYMEGLIFGILWYNVIQNRAENAGTCCKWPLRVPQDNQERQKFQDYELRILIIHKFTSILIFLAGGT